MNMKRFQFLAFLFGWAGVVKAQQWKVCVEAIPHVCSEKNKPALNNQCPVCGEMAAPFKPKPEPYCGDSLVIGADGHLHDNCGLPASSLVRCERCNAAFWQDRT